MNTWICIVIVEMRTHDVLEIDAKSRVPLVFFAAAHVTSPNDGCEGDKGPTN